MLGPFVISESTVMIGQLDALECIFTSHVPAVMQFLELFVTSVLPYTRSLTIGVMRLKLETTNKFELVK